MLAKRGIARVNGGWTPQFLPASKRSACIRRLDTTQRRAGSTQRARLWNAI